MAGFPIVRVVLVVLLVGYLAVRWLPECWRPPAPAGCAAPDPPLQDLLDPPRTWQHGRFAIKAFAAYQVRARVLRVEAYRTDPAADLSPLDFVLGWGAMSDPLVHRRLAVSQSGRFFQYTWTGNPPLPPAEIPALCANTHLIPADALVAKQLAAARAGDVVELDGFLVEATAPGNPAPWRSSLRRTDTGSGACEILWVDSVHLNVP